MMHVYRYVIIEGKKSIEDQLNLMTSIFNEFMTITDVKCLDKQIIFVYEQETDVSFLDVILNIMADTYHDLRIYVSHHFDHIEDMHKHQKFITAKLLDIPFNKYTYLDDKVVLKANLGALNDELKHFILKKYEHDLMMHETIKVYLESDQNMVIAAKKLYVHRNTLIQRIEKFHQVTGFDLKNFIDAFLIYHFIK
jgi:sugar diacid utilization regulator